MAKAKKQRTIIYGIVFAFVILVLFAGQKIPRETPFSRSAVEGASPVMHVFREPILFIKKLGDNLSYYFFVAEKNKALNKKNALLKGWRHEALYLRRENRDLRALLEMAEETTTNPIAGRVLFDTRSPYSKTVLLDVGAQQNIKKGQAVLSEVGLAGRILAVSDTTSRVLLLGDYNARVPVKLLQSGTLAIARGGRDGAMELFLSDGQLEANEGELVVTSGVGGVFAPGLPVGAIVKSGNGTKLKPHTDFTKLGKVVVHRRPVDGVVPDDASHSAESLLGAAP